MQQYIDLSKSELISLSFLNEDDARKQSDLNKGWSFSYVYHFSELKDLYLILKKTNYRKPKDIIDNLNNIGLKFESTPWEERRILEQINALKNFGLIDLNSEIIEDVFKNSDIGKPITKSDLKVFKKIYFNYFRFKEIHSWFVELESKNRISSLNKITQKELSENSNVLFPFNKNNRFTNAFLLKIEDSSDIYTIENGNEDLMRFWDVYIKWGQALNLIEKFSLKELDFKFSSHIKSLTCVYHKSTVQDDFDLLKFLKEEYNAKYIQIPKLIYKIALRYRFSIEEIKEIIIKGALKNSENITLQRTSEIFIREKGKMFFPKYRDSYVSHIMLQY